MHLGCTGKSLLEALILASTNPQYDKIFFIHLPDQYMKNYKLRTCCVHKMFFCFDMLNNICTQLVLSLYFSCTELVNQ